MERKQGRKSWSTLQGSTLREENTGVQHVSTSSVLKIKHLQRLATWASAEVGIPPLGALFGNRLSATAEASGIPLDPSTSLCQRCESILQPGLNCTVRIEKIKKKKKMARGQKKPHILPQNNVVYTCHFCSHRNLRVGTPKGHVKGLIPAKQPCSSDSRPSHKVVDNSQTRSTTKRDLVENVGDGKVPLKPESSLDLKHDTPGSNKTPLKSPITPLLIPENSSKKKRKASVSGPKSETGSATTDSGKGNSKRRRKGWTRLKEIAESNEAENNQRMGNFAIPFLLQCVRKEDKLDL